MGKGASAAHEALGANLPNHEGDHGRLPLGGTKTAAFVSPEVYRVEIRAQCANGCIIGICGVIASGNPNLPVKISVVQNNVSKKFPISCQNFGDLVQGFRYQKRIPIPFDFQIAVLVPVKFSFEAIRGAEMV